MRVAYVGNFGPEYSTENDYRHAFEHLGHTVTQLQENRIDARQLMAAALDSDLLLWTGTWGDAIPLADALDVFHACAKAGIPTATVHLDVFWTTGRGGRKWWLEPMFHTGTVFTADGDHQAEWGRLGVNHVWLPPAVRHDYAREGTFRPEFACDVAFVGSNGHGYHEDVWPYRRQVVDALRDMCARNGWSFRNPGGDEPKIERGDMNDFYASASVTVGDSLCLAREGSRYWSDRAFEAPGRGGFLIMPHIDALWDMYGGLLPTYRWGDFENLEKQVGKWLRESDMREHRRAECHRVVRDGHTYVHRAQTILETVGVG